MYKVTTVCINGMGSSLVLRLNVERAFAELGIEAEVEACDFSSFSGKTPDIVVTSPSLADQIPDSKDMIVISIVNFIDVDQMKSKIKEALKL